MSSVDRKVGIALESELDAIKVGIARCETIHQQPFGLSGVNIAMKTRSSWVQHQALHAAATMRWVVECWLDHWPRMWSWM